MTTYIAFNRDQPFLLPPDLKGWLSEDDPAHFIVTAVDRVRLGAFWTNPQAGGKPQYPPRLMLALLVYCHANGVLSSRRTEQATYHDTGARFIAANTHPDHGLMAPRLMAMPRRSARCTATEPRRCAPSSPP